MAICHSHLDLQDIQEGLSIRSFSISPTREKASPCEPCRAEHSATHSEINPLNEKGSRISSHGRPVSSALIKGHHRTVEFEPVTHIIVLPDAEKGRPRVQMRKMSVSLSFSKAPEDSLDDPSFIPTSPRRICVRLPSLRRSHVRSNSADRQSSNHPLRPCLVSGLDSPEFGQTELDCQNTGYRKSFRSPKSSPTSPRGLAPSSFVGVSSSAPSPESSMLSGFMSRPRPNRSSSTSPSLYSNSINGHSSRLEDPTEALRACCLACYRGTELGLQGEWEDAPWSSGALKKKRKDEEEREKKEAERRRIKEKYGKLPPSSPGGCMDEMDWENSSTFNRFGTGVVVDEVNLVRKNSSDQSSSTGGPAGFNHSVALLRLDRSSSSSSPQADESPLLSPEEAEADISVPSISPPWMPNSKSLRIDKPAAYDGIPPSGTDGSFFPDFHTSSIFGGAVVDAPSLIETPELSPSSTPCVRPNFETVPTISSRSSSSPTDSHIDQLSPPLPSSASLSSSLLQISPSTGLSSSSSPVAHPTPTTAVPSSSKRFLSGLSFGGINKVFKHSTKETGAGHGFF